VLPDLGAISESKSTDYRFRATASRELVQAALAQLVAQLDYSNFKNQVAEVQGQKREHLYHEVWGVLNKLQCDPGYEVKQPAGPVAKPAVGTRSASRKASKPPGPSVHPRPNDRGEPVVIRQPHQASDPKAWGDASATVTLPVGGQVPGALNGLAFVSWAEAPTTRSGWHDVPGQAPDLVEPVFNCPADRHPAAGVVILEQDGRVVLVSPSNAFGGYENTFPKGRVDDGRSLQATAIKEAFEKSGLQVAITGFLGDFLRTTTFTRYYLARRVGGTPIDMGWESQSVRLAPQSALRKLLNGAADRPVLEALASPAAVVCTDKLPRFP